MAAEMGFRYAPDRQSAAVTVTVTVLGVNASLECDTAWVTSTSWFQKKHGKKFGEKSLCGFSADFKDEDME